MTDAEVTHRVEQALLGAMMARPRSAAQLRVRPEHFADERHQAIAAALTGNAGTERGLFGRLIGWFTRRSRAAREAAAYVETLPDLCPEPAHLGTYFQMLAADRDQRAAEAQARIQAQGNQVLDVAAERLGQMRGRADASTGLPRGTARLARALRDLTGQRAPSPAPVQAQAQAVGPDQAQQAKGPAPAPGQAPPQTQGTAGPQGQVPQQANGRPVQGPTGQLAQNGSTSASAPARQAAGPQPGQGAGSVSGLGRLDRLDDLQDAILAAMMQHPDEAWEVVDWLTPQVFGGQRRELYTLLRQYGQAGRDIDPVTLAWGAAQPGPDGQPSRLRPDFVLRIGALDTRPGAAAVLGKMLLADQVVTRELGPDWHLGRRPGTAPAPQGAAETPQPDQAPAQGQQQNQQKRNQQGPASQPGPQNQPQAEKPGPYRQARPGSGSRPSARAGAGTAPVVPGKLVQQPPPPVPGQGGATPQQ